MSEQVWYLLVGGHQVGPVSPDDVRARVRDGSADRATLAFGPGLSAWTPLGAIPALAQLLGPAAAPPLPPRPRGGLTRSTSRSTARRCSSWR